VNVQENQQMGIFLYTLEIFPAYSPFFCHPHYGIFGDFLHELKKAFYG